MKRFSLAKKDRLLNNDQFKAVLAKRKRFSNDFLAVFVAPNTCGFPRLGISVGKHCGKAVIRNRIKRLLREAYRLNRENFPQDLDYLVLLSPVLARKLKKQKSLIKQLSFVDIEKSFLALINLAQKTMEIK